MEDKKCKKCGMPLDNKEEKCACQEDVCCYCCDCPPTCKCGCKNKS